MSLYTAMASKLAEVRLLLDKLKAIDAERLATAKRLEELLDDLERNKARTPIDMIKDELMRVGNHAGIDKIAKIEPVLRHVIKAFLERSNGGNLGDFIIGTIIPNYFGAVSGPKPMSMQSPRKAQILKLEAGPPLPRFTDLDLDFDDESSATESLNGSDCEGESDGESDGESNCEGESDCECKSESDCKSDSESEGESDCKSKIIRNCESDCESDGDFSAKMLKNW